MRSSQLPSRLQSVDGYYPTTSARTPTHHGPNLQRFVHSTRKKREPSWLLPRVRGIMRSSAWR